MGKRIDHSGQRFGRVVVLEYAGTQLSHIATWRCRCDCGKEFVAQASNLRGGSTQSCGCARTEKMKAILAVTMRKHGHCVAGTISSTYQSWASMKYRCTRRNSAHWPKYGGRGISVCAEWLDSFDRFVADMGERPPHTTIDRIDNDGNYEPSNCRWADAKTQRSNQRKRINP
jgi:hypothetical protein